MRPLILGCRFIAVKADSSSSVRSFRRQRRRVLRRLRLRRRCVPGAACNGAASGPRTIEGGNGGYARTPFSEAPKTLRAGERHSSEGLCLRPLPAPHKAMAMIAATMGSRSRTPISCFPKASTLMVGQRLRLRPMAIRTFGRTMPRSQSPLGAHTSRMRFATHTHIEVSL